MEDCFSCKVVSSGAFFASSAYILFGTLRKDMQVKNKKFLYTFSAGAIIKWIIC
jgi:hypothetical protein